MNSEFVSEQLRRPMIFYRSELRNRFVQKIALPESESVSMNATPIAIVSGFGAVSTYSSQVGWDGEEIKFQYDGNGQLYYSEANILNITECQKKNFAQDKMLTLLHVCAKVKVGNPNTISGTCEVSL